MIQKHCEYEQRGSVTMLTWGTRGKGRQGASQLSKGRGDSPTCAWSSSPCYSCHGPLRRASASPRRRAQAHDKDKQELEQDGTELISLCVTYAPDFLASQKAQKETQWSKQGPVSAKYFISQPKCSGWQSCKGKDYSVFPTWYHIFKTWLRRGRESVHLIFLSSFFKIT